MRISDRILIWGNNMNKKVQSILNMAKIKKKELFELFIIDTLSVLLTTMLFILFIHILNSFINNKIIYNLKMFITIWVVLSIFMGCILGFRSFIFINNQVKEMVKQDGTE